MNSCALCQAPKAVKTCAECGLAVCKQCLRHPPPDPLRFHPNPPAWAQKGNFCANCFEAVVEPELQKYQEVLERSEGVKVVYATYHGFLPCLKKAKAPTEVAADAGRGISIQRLKFLAAWEGYDAVIEVETEGRKVRNHGWETKSWGARGTFACLDYKRFRPPEDS